MPRQTAAKKRKKLEEQARSTLFSYDNSLDNFDIGKDLDTHMNDDMPAGDERDVEEDGGAGFSKRSSSAASAAFPEGPVDFTSGSKAGEVKTVKKRPNKTKKRGQSSRTLDERRTKQNSNRDKRDERQLFGREETRKTWVGKDPEDIQVHSADGLAAMNDHPDTHYRDVTFGPRGATRMPVGSTYPVWDDGMLPTKHTTPAVSDATSPNILQESGLDSGSLKSLPAAVELVAGEVVVDDDYDSDLDYNSQEEEYQQSLKRQKISHIGQAGKSFVPTSAALRKGAGAAGSLMRTAPSALKRGRGGWDRKGYVASKLTAEEQDRLYVPRYDEDDEARTRPKHYNIEESGNEEETSFQKQSSNAQNWRYNKGFGSGPKDYRQTAAAAPSYTLSQLSSDSHYLRNGTLVLTFDYEGSKGYHKGAAPVAEFSVCAVLLNGNKLTQLQNINNAVRLPIDFSYNRHVRINDYIGEKENKGQKKAAPHLFNKGHLFKFGRPEFQNRFGRSEFCDANQLGAWFDLVFADIQRHVIGNNFHARTLILCHAGSNDIGKVIGYNGRAPALLDGAQIADTQQLYAGVGGAVPRLEFLTKEILGLLPHGDADNLHNAGNDAYYTLRVGLEYIRRRLAGFDR